MWAIDPLDFSRRNAPATLSMWNFLRRCFCASHAVYAFRGPVDRFPRNRFIPNIASGKEITKSVIQHGGKPQGMDHHLWLHWLPHRLGAPVAQAAGTIIVELATANSMIIAGVKNQISLANDVLSCAYQRKNRCEVRNLVFHVVLKTIYSEASVVMGSLKGTSRYEPEYSIEFEKSIPQLYDKRRRSLSILGLRLRSRSCQRSARPSVCSARVLQNTRHIKSDAVEMQTTKSTEDRGTVAESSSDVPAATAGSKPCPLYTTI
ncbi:hypothetical protein BDW68DRAFT_49324 [Aspergillus falconensis]